MNLILGVMWLLAAVWEPMSGSAPAVAVERDGRQAVRMPCNFAGTTIERASWDLPVKLDLTACRGVQFEFQCADPLPVSQFSFYFRSGGGWYAASFGLGEAKGWSTVLIEKSDTRVEGKPAGWGKIDMVRISAWRGKDANTEFYIANLAPGGADAPIVIVQDESQETATFSKNVANALDELGLPYVVVSDDDITADSLKRKTIAILPFNPSLTSRATDELSKFVEGGGKLLAFYVIPSKLAELAGLAGGAHLKQSFGSIRGSALPGLPPVVAQASWNIRRTTPVEGRSRVVATWFNDKGESTGEAAILASSNCVFMTHVLLNDDAANKRMMLLAMLGHLDSSLWETAIASGLKRAGRFGSHDGFDEVRAAVRARKFPEAMTALAKVQEAALLAHCAAQRPQAGEHRAWWCHSAFGVAGMTWDEAIKNLADNGFTAILPNMLWGGVAYYQSDVLPVAAEVKEKGDQIAACLAACRKYGVECHVWKVNWNMEHHAPKEFVERMQREGRTQVGYDGTPKTGWLCPSHPANQQLEADAMIEVATKYDVAGVHFDYIRYPSGQYCFCSGCRERFEALIGTKVANWPADTRNDKALRQRWLDFRRDNITKVVVAVHDAVKSKKPRVKISAAVFRNWPLDRDEIGQDWKLWCDRGWLDFVCPMDYTPNNRTFENMVAQQREWTGKVPCYPGIGLSASSSKFGIERLIEQIKITRQFTTGGFTIFNYGPTEARDIVPLCGKGITRKE